MMMVAVAEAVMEVGINKGANSRGVGKTWWQTGLVGMSGYTFFGAIVRLIPYNFGASSYFRGAINVNIGTWKKIFKTWIRFRYWQTCDT